MNSIRILSAGILLALTLTSCASAAKVSDEKDANGKEIEYVYYTPTGSNIPVRVRKDQLKTSDTDAAAKDKALSDIQRNSSGRPEGPPGGP